MATLHIDEIDDELYNAIAESAVRENKTIDQQILEILREHLQPKKSEPTDEGFREFLGGWPDDRSAEEIIEDIRSSRTSNESRPNTDVFD